MVAAVVAAFAATPVGADGAGPPGDGVRSVPLEAPSAPATGDPAGFEEMPAARTGIEFVNHWQAPPEFEQVLSTAFAAGGAAVGDIDGDGLADLYLSRPFGGGRLYRNLGDFRFEDVTGAAGLGGAPFWEMGPTFADIDGDGDLDLHVCAFNGPNRLYVNQGTPGGGGFPTFVEAAGAAGIAFDGFSVMMAFADYDRDGDLDGYLVTNRPFSPNESYRVSDREVANRVYRQLEKQPDGRFAMPEHLREIFDVLWNPQDRMDMFIRAGQYDRLFRNDGPAAEGGVPRFTDVTREAGLLDNGMGLSATWWDCDDDGWPDLYVANDYYGADRLFRNLGDGRFEDVAAESLPHTAWYSMGSNVADLNNDGLLDLMGSDMAGTNHFRQKIGMGDMSRNAWFLDTAVPRQYMRNTVFVNTGTGRFLEAAFLAGLAKSDWTWAPKFGDFDSDGWVDLYITNGMTGDFFNSDTIAAQRDGTYLAAGEAEKRPEPKRDTNLAFRNLGDLAFEDVGAAWGLSREAASFGAALGDLDGDGDLDLVVNHFEDPVGVYRNHLGRANQRVRIRLEGTRSNRFGIDARIRLWTPDGRVRARSLTLARGFCGSDEPVVHVGLGTAERIERLVVEWPSGVVQEVRGLESGRLHTIVEAGESNTRSFREERRAASGPPLYAVSEALRGATHIERPFDDFARQPLLPWKHSQLGPGAAWGDLDGDGDDDLFVGQARGSGGRVLFREEGRFVVRRLDPFDADADREDLAPLTFDADGDGDRDLFVVSGGVECEPGDAVLADRLYLNDGDGNFTAAPAGSLPDLRDSGAAACAADVDRDGDLDLFVGGRVVPGRYPETPASRLLLNDGTGRFDEATPDDLRTTGMVTGALWSDVDGDGWVDLLVTHEWGPVKLFRNDGGRLADATAASGLAERTGWWNSIASADIDGDGDLDYAVGNVGLNTKYHASLEHPALIFHGDFDGSGRPRIVEAEFEGAVCYPVRGRSCSSQAMPGLAEKFPTFAAFASAALDEIYGRDRLAEARRLEATTFESGILVNVTEPGGPPRLEFRPLPRLAQISPVFGLAFAEVDGDGLPDLLMVQNFFGPQRETGRMNGGVGLVLRNGGGARFDPVWPDQSGLVVPGDATCLTISDIDGDGIPDFHVGVNDGESIAFEADAGGRFAAKFASVQLRGPRGNPDAVGARVSLVPPDGGALQTREVTAGGGYLSQSSPRVFFGLPDPEAGARGRVEVAWPDGSRSSHDLSELEERDGRRWIDWPGATAP